MLCINSTLTVLSFFFNSRFLQTGILQTGPNQFVEKKQKQNRDNTRRFGMKRLPKRLEIFFAETSCSLSLSFSDVARKHDFGEVPVSRKQGCQSIGLMIFGFGLQIHCLGIWYLGYNHNLVGYLGGSRCLGGKIVFEKKF